jgi:hypothetical protein
LQRSQEKDEAEEEDEIKGVKLKRQHRVSEWVSE